MKKNLNKLITGILFTGILFTGNTQNLVYNGDVDVPAGFPFQNANLNVYNTFPNDGAIGAATGWSSAGSIVIGPEIAAPDVLSYQSYSCTSGYSSTLGHYYCIPNNLYTQNLYSASGNATGYIGLTQKLRKNSNGTKEVVDEHACATLTEALDEGCYYVRFAASSSSLYYTNNPQVCVRLVNSTGAYPSKLIYTSPILPAGEGWNYYLTSVHITGADINQFDRIEFFMKREAHTTGLVGTRYFHCLIDDASVIKHQLNPSIQGNSSFCGTNSAPFTFDGSASQPNSNVLITNHAWLIGECDASGNLIGTDWWGPWTTGAPGAFTYPVGSPGGPNLQCGKYYRVRLVVQTACDSWEDANKVIYINCPPVFSMHGSTDEICSGETAYISPNITYPSPSNTTIEITPGIPFMNYTLYLIPIYTGPAATYGDTPAATTTYRITVTDNTTGCSTVQFHTVYVKNNNPSFNLTANTTNSTHFELTATPNNTSNFPHNFNYLWYIDELDINGNIVYQVYDNTCWMNFPTVVDNVFEGVDATIPGYTGTVFCGWPTVGKFKYNTTYRITRVIWSDECPLAQFSMLVAPTRSSSGLSIYEDVNAPDYTQLASTMMTGKTDIDKISIKVFPNPSNGLFVLETNKATTGSADVFDAMGKKITSIVLNGSGKYSIDLGQQAKGIYTLLIVSGNQKCTEKIVVE